MGAVQQTESVDIRVRDVAAAVEFYTDVMGMVVLERDGETTYLGCGLDTRYDLAVREGDPGVDRFAMRVTDEAFDRHAEALAERGVETWDHTGPGHERGQFLALPESGVSMGFVTVADSRYHHTAEASGFLDSTAPVSPDRSAICPTDLDHVAIVTPDVEAEARFLEEALDFRVSDAQVRDGEWANAFVRYGLHHHDVAMFAGDPDDGDDDGNANGDGNDDGDGAGASRLDHVAWAAQDVAQMKLFADRLAQRGHELSSPFTKHGPGGNVAIYVHEPGGTRFEYNTDMATVEPDCPEGIYRREDRKGGTSLWGAR